MEIEVMSSSYSVRTRLKDLTVLLEWREKEKEKEDIMQQDVVDELRDLVGQGFGVGVEAVNYWWWEEYAELCEEKRWTDVGFQGLMHFDDIYHKRWRTSEVLVKASKRAAVM
jgi:hypothetical protein